MAPHKSVVFTGRLAPVARLILLSWSLGFDHGAGFAAGRGPEANDPVAEARSHERTGAEKRIEALRAEIAHADELYFKKSAPVISDFAYDLLKRELAALEVAFPDIAPEPRPVAGPDDDRSGLFPTGRHRARMLSLNKCYTQSELRAFDARLTRQLGQRELDYVVEPKFDGLAISVTFENGRLVRAVTRGDGTEGDDVTANVATIRSLPPVLQGGAPDGAANPMPEMIELRGEIFISLPEFARLNRERESAGDEPYANPRNLAAGSLRQLDSREAARRPLEIVFYGLGACEPQEDRPDSQLALLRQLRAWGLPTIDAPRQAHGADAMWRAVQALGRDRAGFRFPTDGAVVKLDAVALQDRIGATPQAPLWAMAFKFAPARVETRITAITLQLGRTGVLTPVAELVPVPVGGSMVARASLFNREEIARRDIRVGDYVWVEKAGEIIPAMASVNRTRRTAGTAPFVFPENCPACQARLVQLPGAAAVRCPNVRCPAQVRRRVEFFCSAECMGISGLGPATVDQLVRRGLVGNVADLFRLRRDDLLGLGRKSDKSADRLLAAIEKSKHVELWRVIHGLGIPGVGETASRELARRFGGLAELARARQEDLVPRGGPAVSHLGETTATAVLAYLADPANQAMITDLVAAGVRPRPAPVDPPVAPVPPT